MSSRLPMEIESFKWKIRNKAKHLGVRTVWQRLQVIFSAVRSLLYSKWHTGSLLNIFFVCALCVQFLFLCLCVRFSL